VLEQLASKIQEQTNVSKYHILKVLLIFRKKMLLDVPQEFKGEIGVDDTYLGGQWKNKRLSVKAKLLKPKHGRGTTKQPVFGILCRNGKVWAGLIANAEATSLQPLIE